MKIQGFFFVVPVARYSQRVVRCLTLDPLLIPMLAGRRIKAGFSFVRTLPYAAPIKEHDPRFGAALFSGTAKSSNHVVGLPRKN